VKTYDFIVGMNEPLEMMVLMIPPTVSIPNERGDNNDYDSLSFFRFFSADDSSLYGGSINDCIIRVNTGIWFFSIEEIFD